uniref:Nonstructural protein WIV domain-containing protein n=2 Tax=unclassified Virgaviridae TaxID=1527522 RepID=A0A6B9KG81_9VIRU|nr:hypothetical protein [Atrato Virga-like virus 6]QHA33769.1 hypothetical protein [Atrato Virga-like virus 7]QHA33773.1 hypothetical protein [Atrato Virga-like virus 7]QHA33777.1 hypothetical protein [Atrato Virga-like virus 7]QHA33781.1 hypothetical protein [Atrato Virga-like virus 7]
MFDFVFDFFSRLLDVFRGSVGNEVARNLILLQRERALIIAQTFVTDVYVFDQSGYFNVSEQRRHDTIYYLFKDGKFGVLEPAVQASMKNSKQYLRFVSDEVESDGIGVYIPFEVCFIKSKNIRNMVMATSRPMESRIEAMKRFVENYDKMHAGKPATGDQPTDLSRISILSKLAQKN